MAQSDKIGRTALGLEPFWDKPSSNPPISWEKWRSQLKMALVAKTNIELDELLQERPTAVIYPPEPVEEQPVQNPTQTMERERMTRYNQAVAKWKNECNHIDRIGVLCGDKPWDMADRKAKSLIYLSLGIEGRKMHARKFPHTNVEAKSTMELWEELEQTFIRPRNVTFDRYLLLTRKQHRGETMEQFHSALRSLAEHCQLGYLEDALLRDIFTANMIDQEIQKELLKTTLAPEKALELAVSIELGIRSQLAIQARQPADVPSTPLIGREEPIMEISSSRYRGSNRPLSTYRGTTRGIGRASNNSNNRITTHNCRNCGQPWDVNHRSRCQAIGQTCRRCNKQNHFAKVCRSNLNRPQLGRSVNEIENQGLEQTTQGVNMTAPNPDTHSTYDDSTDDYSVNMMESPDDPTTPSKLHMQYGNSKFWVMVDSGSSTSIVTEQMAKDIEARDSNTWWSRTTNPMKLKSYTDTPIKNLGTLYCDIECNGWKAGRGDIIVVPNKHRAIVGRDLFKPLGIQLKQHDSPTSTGKNINSIDNPQPLTLKEEIATKYKNLTTRIGRSKHHKVKSLFKSNYTPVHQKGRRVPLHLETQVEEELRNLQNDGHITKLEKCSDEFFISPIVITVKKDKSIKLAMDSKTINKAIHKNKYQMHNIDCLMDNIAQTITQSSDEGEVLFSTIDLRYAYSQIPLDEDTAKQCNFNIIGGQATGTYRFNNGFYGLTDMPAEFQKAIDKTLYNLTNTFSFLDDIIIVTGGGLQNHKEKLFKCLDRLNEENLAINLNKCHFAKNKITWLGYEIDQKGIKPIVSKTQAILNLKPPTSNKQLKSFLGSVHHLTKFIPNLAPLCREFRNLLQKDTKYIWTNHHQTKFENIKECIRNLTENTHYDTKRKTRVKTDASRSGLGAVLEQETCDGWETISYASRFLNKAEEKYSINELELLGVVWALEHFKHYLLGHHFIVQTDHRALLSILKERSSKIHQSRLTRWYDRLIPFNFTIEHIAGTKMGLADYMSRNPSELAKPPSTYDENFIIAQIDVIKETLKILRKRGRPKKHNNNTTQHITKTTHNGYNAIEPNTMESSHDSNTPRNYQPKRQRGRPRKTKVESSNDSTQTRSINDKRSTFTNKFQKTNKYNLRNSHKIFQPQPNETNYDVINNKQDTQQTNTQAHLPINTAISKQQFNSNKHLNSANEMENTTNNPEITTTNSPVQKTLFSMRNYLSPTPKQEDHQPITTANDQLLNQLDSIFNKDLIAAMINRDTVLREIRDCIINEDQARCKSLSKQIHAKWGSLSVNNGCILVDNKLAIPNILKESVMDVLHSTHPGAWGMTELGQRLWWPFINRDLINKSKTCRPCTEFGKNLKSILRKSDWTPLPPCSEPNEEIQLDFGGPIFDGQGREVYFLACIDRFSKFPTLKLVSNANGSNIEKFLNKYITQHGVPRNIRLDQARCLKGNKIQQLCKRNNIELIYAPANDHRPIGLVERLIQTVKRRLGCIKLDPNQKPFNIKNALQNISFELRTCRKKISKLSPFEAHYGRKANTALSNITSKPNIKNLNWSNTLKHYLDDNIIGEDELISQDKWYDEDLDSDEEVRTTKQRKLQEARNDEGEIPRTFKLPKANFEEPLASNSPRLQLARKTLAASRNKKQLQGLYEAIPEGAALVKSTNNTITVKVPGQQDTVLNKSDIAKFGTPEQRKIPLINFAARKTVRNHHVKLIQNMESHAQDIKNKIIGQRAIRKRGPQASNSDRKAKANLTKVNRIRIPPKKTYQPSPKKGSPKKRKLSTASSQASADEQGAEPHDSDSSQDSNVTFKQHGNPFVIVTDKASTRRSARDKKKPKRYGELTELPSSDDSMDNRRTLRPHKGVSIASYSPPRSTPAATCTSPAHSVIPTIAPSPIDPNENSGIPSPDPNERQTQEDVLAIYNEDQPERSLQPHEY